MRIRGPMRLMAVIAVTALLTLSCGGDDTETTGAAEETTTTAADETTTTAAQDTSTTTAAAVEAETVTIGVIGPYEGGFAEIGQNILEGAELAVTHINEDGGLLGGAITLAVDAKDEQMNPEAATQAAREFINEGTPLIAGFLSSSDCFAAAPVIDELGGVFVSSTCSSNDLTGVLTGEAPYARSFFLATRDIQMARGLAAVVADRFPNIEVFDVFGYDYSVGHAMWENFIDELRTYHGMEVEINQEFFVPFGEANYRTQISALSRGLEGDQETRGLFLSMFGAGTSAFVQQSEPFDLVTEYAVTLNSGSYYPVARALDGAAPEIWASYDYHPDAYDNAVNDRFVSDFQELHGRLPVAWAAQGYSTIMAYAAAIEAAGSADPDAIVSALEGLTFETPRGTMFMNGDTHLAETDILIKHTVGNPDAPEGVEFLDAYFVPAEETLRR